MSPDDIAALEQELQRASNLDIKLEIGKIIPFESSYAVEIACMLNANEKRRREFYTGRHLARKAMRRAGLQPQGMGRGKLGNPLWPPGCWGSITHDRHWAAAIAIEEPSLLGLGVDLLEQPETVSDELAGMILSEPERLLLSTQFPNLPPVALAFSLKESVVKVVSLLSGRYVELLDIKLIGPHGSLSAEVKGLSRSVPCNVYPVACGLFTFSYLLKE